MDEGLQMNDSTAARAMTSEPVAGTSRRQWWVLAVLATAQLMVILDVTIVNIALPSLQADLGIADDARQWVITAYSLAFGSLLVFGGRVGDRVGRRRVFLVGVAGFALASVLGGLADDFAVLVVARALQGAFGALMAPAALSLLTVTFESSPQRSRAFGIWGATTGAGGAIGLLLGGVLTEYLSWRWCLLVNVVFAVVALVGGAVLLPRGRGPERPSLNLPSAALVSAGLFAVVLGLSRAETHGWSDAGTLSSLVAGVVLTAGFVVVQARIPNPLLPLRTLANRHRGGALAAILLSGAGVFGVFLFLTYFLQQVLAFSAVRTGVAFLPMVVVLGLVAAAAGSRLLPRYGPRPLVVVGMVLSAGALVLMTRFTASTSYAPDVLLPLMVAGVGCGLIFASALGTATLGVQARDAGVGSALVSTAQQVGGSIGVALLSTMAATAATDRATALLVNLRLPQPTPAVVAEATLAGYHTAFWWAAAFFLAGAVVCGALIPRGVATVASGTAGVVPVA
ncbi:DHA2 family efflux MFS transporter permease subunit [Cellulomonas hominis]